LYSLSVVGYNNSSRSSSLCIQLTMWFSVALLALALSQLGGTQECEVVVLSQDQLKKEIQANMAAALRQGAITNTLCSGNETHIILTQEQLNSTLEKIVDVAMEKCVATAVEEVTAQILSKMNSTMDKVAAIEKHITTSVDEVVTNISASFEQLVSPLMTQLHLLRVPGSTPSHPATSCREIKELSPTAPSDYYWLRGRGDSSHHMYCDMSRSCGGITGGWMRVAAINMTNSSHTCPEGLKLLSTPKRLCAMNIDGGGCSSATFDLHGIRYTHVCGKIIGYQQKTPDAFSPYYHNRDLTIDDGYVEGISLTHGHNPRKHIWTFAAALHEVITTNTRFDLCPCTNIHNPLSIPIPPYVGRDYFCDTASENHYQFKFYPSDPLWDGQGCGRLNTCCSFNNPPWFMKELPSSTRDNIEMRLCAGGGRTEEDINFEAIELYVL